MKKAQEKIREIIDAQFVTGKVPKEYYVLGREGKRKWRIEQLEILLEEELQRQKKEIIKKLEKVSRKDYKAWGGQEALYDLKARLDQAINQIKEL